MKIAFYITGTIFTLTALLCLAVVFGDTDSNASFGYALGATLLVGGAVILYAAKSNYNGGLCFLFGVAVPAVCISPIWASHEYDQGDLEQRTNFFIGGAIVTLLILILASVLLWFGHKRHKNSLIQPANPVVGQDTAPTEGAILSGISSSDIPGHSPEQTSPVLYPPMRTWQMLLLMIFSGCIYAVFQTYRAAKDLYDLGEKQIRPKLYVIAMLIPIYGIVVFLRLTKSIAKIGKTKGIHFKIKPSHQFWLLLLTGVTSVFMPTFLYPLTVSIAAIPWLIINEQMNRLRMAYASEWHQPANRYNWRQILVLVLGVPLMGLVIYGSKEEFRYFTGDKLDIGQTVSGEPQTYQLSIPDPQWRQVPTGTLYPDTNLELVNNVLKEWVVVRILPSQQQTLDGFVDQRREVVSASWKDFDVTETRTLLPGAGLTPISLAYFTQNNGVANSNPPMYVATVVTPEHAIEVIGQGSKNSGSTALELVKSFQLTAKGKP